MTLVTEHGSYCMRVEIDLLHKHALPSNALINFFRELDTASSLGGNCSISSAFRSTTSTLLTEVAANRV